MEHTTRWSNVGLFWNRLGAWWHFGIMTPWGNVILKPWGNRLFSERYGDTPHLKLFGACISWRRLRQIRTETPKEGENE